MTLSGGVKTPPYGVWCGLIHGGVKTPPYGVGCGLIHGGVKTPPYGGTYFIFPSKPVGDSRPEAGN